MSIYFGNPLAVEAIYRRRRKPRTLTRLGWLVIAIGLGAISGIALFIAYMAAYPTADHNSCDPHRVHSVDVVGCE